MSELDPRIGSLVAGYRLEALIGRGGMSVVYLAEHVRLGRKVALKLLAPALSEDSGFRARFERESQRAAEIDHPNIIPIYDAGEANGELYIAMKYVAGSDLKAAIKDDGVLTVSRALFLLEQAAAALDAAHDRDLIHRDVKPANILVERHSERVYVTDFGVVKHTLSRGQTKTGFFIGTTDYAAPEQIEGSQVDARTDVYSLGCVLYECLAGAPPFDREADIAVMHAHLTQPPPHLSEVRSDLPKTLDRIIARAMAKDKDERFTTCAALVQAARAAVLDQPFSGLNKDSQVLPPADPTLAGIPIGATQESPGSPSTPAPAQPTGETPAQADAPSPVQSYGQPPSEQPSQPTGAGGPSDPYPPTPTPATPPGGPPGPPDQPSSAGPLQPSRRGRSSLIAALAAVAAAVAAGLIVFFVTRSDDDSGASASATTAATTGSTSGTTTDTSTTDTSTGAATGTTATTETDTGGAATTPEEVMAALIPNQIFKECGVANTPPAGATAEAVCVPSETGNGLVPDRLELSIFPDSASLGAAYDEIVAAHDITPDSGRCNGVNWGGEQSWNHGPDKLGGHVLCYFDGNDAVLVWTHEKLGQANHHDLLGIAREGGVDHTALFNWWRFWTHRIGKTEE